MRKQCFYCNAIITESDGRGDHFPIPKSCGGNITVNCCKVCHEMKDLISIDIWSKEWIKIIDDKFYNLPREIKLFIARIIKVFCEVEKSIKRENVNNGISLSKKKHGRPKREIDIGKVLRLRREGKTHQIIAKDMNLSKSVVWRTLKLFNFDSIQY